MSTCQQIIDRAFAKSAAARPNTQTSPTQLVDRIGQCLREAFQVMSRENNTLTGVMLSVPFNGTGWPRPVDCVRVLMLRADVGTVANPAIPFLTEIPVVPFDDQQIAVGSPCLTELGQAFVPTGQAIDPAGGTITIIYARAPILPTQTTDAIDPLFPPSFDDFLQYDLAAFLAIQDKRTEDQQTFLGMKGAILQQLIDWTTQQTYSLVQRTPQTTPPMANSNDGREQPAKGA